MQNTVVVWGMAAGETIKNLDLGGKNEKGERKTEENYIKTTGKGLKNASFWVINSKTFRPARRNLSGLAGGKISNGGGMIEIYTPG